MQRSLCGIGIGIDIDMDMDIGTKPPTDSERGRVV